MKYLPLVWAALRRKPARAIMTLLSITVAFTLFGMMIGFRATMNEWEENAHADRIWANPRFGIARMPAAMAQEIAAIPGVKDVSNMSYLPGYVGDPKNRAFVAFFDDEYGRIFPDWGPSLEQWDMIRHDRGIVVMSRKLAERFHKKVGDLFTMTSTEVKRADGSNNWTMKVASIGEDTPLLASGYIVGNYDFYDQSVPESDRGKTAEVDLLVADATQADAIAAKIDRMFANSASPTQSWTEKMAFNPANNFGGIDMFGLTQDIALVGLTMILFLTANVIAQSVRERLPEFAMLKTIGFSDRALVGLVVLEAALPCVTGAAAGIALSTLVAARIPAFFPPDFGFPMPTVSPMVVAWAMLAAFALAFGSAALPALRLSRIDIATALVGTQMNQLHQIVAICALNFRNLPRRAWQSLVVVTGMCLVIAVLLSMLSMTVGLRQANGSVGDPGLVLAVTQNVTWEGASSVPRDQARIVMDAPGIAHAPDGSLLADPQIYTQAPVLLRRSGGRQQIALRGIGPKGLMLRPELHIVAGRMFRPGARELIVGIGAPGRFQGVAVGDKIILPDGEWPIVGSFATGDLQESGLMGDADTLMAATRKPNYTSMLIRLASDNQLPVLQRALTSDPRLKLEAVRQRDWYEKANLAFFTFLNVMIYAVSLVLAVGALFGCVNVMYASVDSRGREIATLRALGFGGFAVAFSVVLEAALLSLTGALIGVAFVWWRYDGVETGFAVNIFKLTISPMMIATALLWAIAVALLGGLLPSFRAARVSIVDGLRAT